jgi:hypothetical protein
MLGVYKCTLSTFEMDEDGTWIGAEVSIWIGAVDSIWGKEVDGVFSSTPPTL